MIEIRAVQADAVRPLRKTLLRPNQDVSELVYGGDTEPDTLHAAAFDGEEIVGIASVSRQPDPTGKPAFRLRGMGTARRVRGLGVGRDLLEQCYAHCAEKGAKRVWCNARLSAVGFYTRMGFKVVGDQFELPGIGPHVVMSRGVSPS